MALISFFCKVAFSVISIFASGYLLSRSNFTKFFSSEPARVTSDTL